MDRRYGSVLFCNEVAQGTLNNTQENFMSTDVKALLNQIKNMQEYSVEVDVPNGIAFNGAVPFNLKISGDKATFSLLAISQEDASERVNAYLNSLG
jgi:hypothetical protein